MAEVIVTPDVEAAVVAYLNGVLTPPVSVKVPNPRPASFVRVLAAGGAGRSNVVVQRATVIVEAWADTSTAAADLGRLAEAHMLSDNAPFSASSFSAMANLPDPASTQARYTATFQVTVRATA